LLSSVPADHVTIVADLEAGIGTLTRLEDAAVDATIIVVEPTPRSIDVAQRAIQVATERQQGHIVIVANKIADDEDLTRITTAFHGQVIMAVPADDVVDRADRHGLSPLDVDPSAPAIEALEALASRLIALP